MVLSKVKLNEIAREVSLLESLLEIVCLDS